MRPVSDSFLLALRGSHIMRARATIVEPGQSGVSPTGINLPIETGDCQFDATADIRGTLEMTVDASWWPADGGGLLTPYGNEIFIERGIVLEAGAPEYVSQGYFCIDRVSEKDAPFGQIRVSGKDRMMPIIQGRLLAPIAFAASDTMEDIFDVLVLDVLPDAVIVLDSEFAASPIGRASVCEQDRYKFLFDLVKARGYIMYWNYRGELVVTELPDPTATVFEVNSGEDGVLVSLNRELSRQNVYNAVVAIGEAPDSNMPVRAVARDLNPNSPTYWNGSFGKVPRFFNSTFMTTQDHVNAAASTMLAKTLGLPHNLDFNAVPNSALEVYDPILVSTKDGPRRHVLEQITTPLVAGSSMSGATRQKLDQIFETGDA